MTDAGDFFLQCLRGNQRVLSQDYTHHVSDIAIVEFRTSADLLLVSSFWS
jgi:hypothetical protein